MWVNKSPEELIQKKQKDRINSLWATSCLGFLAFLSSLFIFGKYSDRVGLVPIDEIPKRIIPSVIVAIVIIFLIQRFLFKKKTESICPKCGTTKMSDVVKLCRCGGNFEDLETMKWVDEVESRK
jgi:hypothetical protein